MELAQEPSLSGAYIRSLVKQLTTTTKPKETMKTKHHGNQNLRKNIKVQPQHHKKQVRRRLHTSRPYQEKLLNMAEARREIVTALKFHRASMKQASEEEQQQKYQNQHHQQQKSLLVMSHSSQHVSNFDYEQELRFKSRRNPRIYPSSCTNNYSNDFSYSSYFSHPSLSFPNTHTWPNSSSFSPSLLVENSNFTLPNQTLGLNLSLHDFNNLDATLLLNNNNYSSLCSYSSPTSSSPPLFLVNDHEVPSYGISQGEGVSLEVDTIESSATTKVNEGGSHAAMDDEDMEEMRSLGEQYQMEWNDTMNLVTSILWFNFLKKMEHDDAPQEGACHHVFDEFMEFPTWLNAHEEHEERCLEEWSEDYFLDLNLPW